MIHELDNILLSKRVYDSWLSYIPVALTQLKFENLEASEIPDEQFEELENGNGQIFVTVRGKKIKMLVPKNEWAFVK